MCGLAGYFARDGISAAEGRALLERMLGVLGHRGPDDRGLLAEEHAGLGSTRLAIIDPASGHMPVFSEDRSISAVLNGEIYDHRASRVVLAERGHRFASGSDAEILPHMYEEHGVELCPKLTGMFAFALWDRTRRRLLLARDRMGIKPLFWTETGGLVLFASELKSLLASGLIPRKLDPAALRDVGSAGYPVPPRTMVAGIFALPPATWMTLELERRSEPVKYWAPPYPGLDSSAPAPGKSLAAARRAEDWVAELRDTFDKVVADHLLADVPVGSYLSGGLDSVSVAARAAALGSGGKLRTFSMTFPAAERRFDESEHSDLAAAAIGSDHTRVPQGPIDEADYRGTIRAMESPQVHTVAFCLYRLSRAVRDAGLKVVLSGEGADETFAGYSVFKLGKLRRTPLGSMPVRRLLSRIFLGRRQPALHHSLKRWWLDEKRTARRYGVLPPWIEQWWLLADAWRTILARPQALDPLPDVPLDLSPVVHPLHKELRFEQATRLDGWVLALGDRLSMAHSVEVRVPFLDHRIVELTARAPPALLLRRLEEKYLLRAAMAGRFPEPLRQRRKRAFVAPIGSWLFEGEPPEFVRAALSAEAVAATGLFRPEELERRWAILRSGQRDLATIEASWTMNLALGLQILCEELQLTTG